MQLEEYTVDCFSAVDEAILREPHGINEQRQALLLEVTALFPAVLCFLATCSSVPQQRFMTPQMSWTLKS